MSKEYGGDVQWHTIAAAAGIVAVIFGYVNIVASALGEKDAMLRSEQTQRLTIREHEAFKVYVEREIATLREEVSRLRSTQVPQDLLQRTQKELDELRARIK